MSDKDTEKKDYDRDYDRDCGEIDEKKKDYGDGDERRNKKNITKGNGNNVREMDVREIKNCNDDKKENYSCGDKKENCSRGNDDKENYSKKNTSRRENRGDGSDGDISNNNDADNKKMLILPYKRLRYIDDVHEKIKPLLEDIYDHKRYQAFLDGVEYVEYEYVDGDILEFGVASGITLLYFTLALQRYKRTSYAAAKIKRRVIGFDCFEGLPANSHPRWPTSIFKTNLISNHPSLKLDEVVTMEKIEEMFDVCDLPRPILVKGYFRDTLPPIINGDCDSKDNKDCKINRDDKTNRDDKNENKEISERRNNNDGEDDIKECKKENNQDLKINTVAIVHIDCDLYESCKDVLDAIKPALQNGTIIYFDDYNHFKGDPNMGEKRAVREFLQENPDISFEPFLTYTNFATSFIVNIKCKSNEDNGVKNSKDSKESKESKESKDSKESKGK